MKKNLFDDDEPFYINQEGLFVFTEQFLLQRGYCCGNGCLHCPYDYKQVLNPERRKRLQDEQEQRKKEQRTALDG